MTRSITRRTVLTTGAKLAYAAPVVAASLQLDALRAAALDSSCTGLPPEVTWTFDPSFAPLGAPAGTPGFPACCSCAPIATATYYPAADFCCPPGFEPNPDAGPTCRDTDTKLQVISFLPAVCIATDRPISPAR